MLQDIHTRNIELRNSLRYYHHFHVALNGDSKGASKVESIWKRIPDWQESNEISEGLWRKEIPAYDEKVVREVICNALVHRPYTTKYHVSPTLISSVKSNLPTSLKTIEPYRLRALIEEELRFHPDSMVADISKRLPDVDIEELKKTIRKMAIDRQLTNGGRKFRTYRLP